MTPADTWLGAMKNLALAAVKFILVVWALMAIAAIALLPVILLLLVVFEPSGGGAVCP